MKILLVSSSAPFGKGESFVVSEVNRIASLGNDVILFPAIIRKGNPNRFEFSDAVCLIAKKTFSFSVIINFLKFIIHHPILLFKIVLWLTDSNIKNSLKNYILIPKALWLAEFLRGHPVDHIHAHWVSTPSTVAMLVSRLTGIPWSATAHRGDIVANNLLNEKIKRSSFIRFISKSSVSLAKERAKLQDHKVHVLHLGISVSEGQKNKSSMICPFTKKITILCPANLIPVKGHKLLFKAISVMKNRDDLNVLVAGDGELKSSLEKMAYNLGISHQIQFSGHVPHSDLMNMYRKKSVDVVVLPSQDLGRGIHEGIPVSLMEAMSFSIPVVSTLTGGIPELLQGDNGELFGQMVDPNDHLGLANILDELVLSTEKRRELGQLCFHRIVNDFNQETVVQQLLGLIYSSARNKEN